MEMSERKYPRMQERGYKALTTYVKEAVYFALKRRAKDLEMSHSKYLVQLVEEDLRKKGYLDPLPSPAPAQAKTKRGG